MCYLVVGMVCVVASLPKEVVYDGSMLRMYRSVVVGSERKERGLALIQHPGGETHTSALCTYAHTRSHHKFNGSIDITPLCHHIC